MGKLQETHLVNLLDKLAKHLLQDDHQSKQIRDIYATCIKTIINKVPDTFAEIVCNSILKNCFGGKLYIFQGLIKFLLGLKNIKDSGLEEELIEIINNVLKKFTIFLFTYNNAYLKNEYPTYLLGTSPIYSRAK